MDFLDPDARALLKTAGADVREGSERVRFDRGMVLERIVTAPPSFTLARHEPRPRPRHRRGLDRVRVGGERAERQRPRPRPARRQPRRLPGPDPAVADARRRPLLRGLPGRADRHPPVGPPPPRDPRPAHARRQGDPLLLAGPPAQPRRHRDGPPRARHRRRDAGARAVGLHGHQLELAAPARHADAPGHPRDVGPEPGHRDDPVHPRRGDGAGDPRRGARRAERRGARRDDPDPGGPARAPRSRTAGSPRTWTCSRARRRSGRRSTCGPR